MTLRTQILVAAVVALIAVSCSSGSNDDTPASTEPEVQTGTAEDGTADGTSTAAAPET